MLNWMWASYVFVCLLSVDSSHWSYRDSAAQQKTACPYIVTDKDPRTRHRAARRSARRKTRYLIVFSRPQSWKLSTHESHLWSPKRMSCSLLNWRQTTPRQKVIAAHATNSMWQKDATRHRTSLRCPGGGEERGQTANPLVIPLCGSRVFSCFVIVSCPLNWQCWELSPPV